MAWQPILVGVDASPEAARAAALGAELAREMKTSCHLVHAARDAWTASATVVAPDRAQELSRALVAQARDVILQAVRGSVPDPLAEALLVEPGKVSVVLRSAAARLGAGLIIVGGKPHGAVDRWVHGSTAQALVRTAELPILVATQAATPRRVLVAVDVSAAAQPTIQAAAQYAGLCGAELRGLSVIEPLPVLPDVPYPMVPDDYYAEAEQELDRAVWPQLDPHTEKQVRYGRAVETILREVHDWRADLLVVGPHGRGWAERALVGSVTERLLSHLPTALLVVPAHGAIALARAPAGRPPADRRLALV